MAGLKVVVFLQRCGSGAKNTQTAPAILNRHFLGVVECSSASQQVQMGSPEFLTQSYLCEWTE